MIRRNGPGRPRREFWQQWTDERRRLQAMDISYGEVGAATGIDANRVRCIMLNQMSARPDEERKLVQYFQRSLTYENVH